MTAIDFDNTLAELRKKLATQPFLEQQIQKYFVDNPHRIKIVLKPDAEMEEKASLDLTSQLAELKSKLSEPEKKQILERSRLLKKLQEEKEDLSSLPSLKISDIPKDIKFLAPTKTGLQQKDVTFYERPTNGIIYLTWYFAIDNLSDEERLWLPLLSNLLTNTGAGDFTYEEMAKKITRHTGGFSSSPSIEKRLGEGHQYQEFFVLTGKALNRNLEKLFEIAKLLIGPRDFREEDHIQKLVAQRTNNLINSVVQAGHNYAASLAGRNFGRSSYVEEIYGGVHQIQFMKEIAEKSILDVSLITHQLRYLVSRLIKKENLSMLVTGDSTTLKQSEALLIDFFDQLKTLPSAEDKPQELLSKNFLPKPITKDEAWCTTTPVSYVAKAIKTVPYRHNDSAKLYVLSNLLKSCFLHGEIREKGGAYGAMAGYNSDEGIFNMLSYRDPNLFQTVGVFEKALVWLKSGDFTDQDVEETILQTCSNMDTPSSPAAKATIEYIAARKGKTKKDREKFREGVLATRKEDLIRVGEEHLGEIASISAVTSETIAKREQPPIPLDIFELHQI